LAGEPHCSIDVATEIPRHVGLGSGTQLALAVAAGLNAFLGRPAMAVEDLARATGRGRRSAIGLHGFAHGGLLVESGKLTPEEISPLAERAHLPKRWRFVLLRPRGEVGLSGEAERRAFELLPPVPHERTEKLQRLAREALVPSAGAGDFNRFSSALYEFNHEAGLCFAAQQEGAYATPRVRHLVEQVRGLGVTGVAQTSWGPTVAALLPDAPAAEAFVSKLRADDLEITIAAPNNCGAQVVI
jgi:beta-RFAP synthase